MRSDLRIELNDLNYPDIHVHVAYNSHFGGPWGHGGLQKPSEVMVTSQVVKFELSDLNYLKHTSLAYDKAKNDFVVPEMQLICVLLFTVSTKFRLVLWQ